MNVILHLCQLRFRLSTEFRQNFYEDFASALRDGAASNERLKKLSERSRRRMTGWAPLYDHWLRKMRRMSFAHSLQHASPSYEVMVLTAAEEDGRLDEAMTLLGRGLRLKSEKQGIYFASLISPILAFAVILAFFVAYALVIAPENLQALELEKWPPLSHFVYSISSSLVNHWVYYLIGVVLILWLIIWSRPNWYGWTRKPFDIIPLFPWRSYRGEEASTFLLSLAILLQSNNHGMKTAMEKMRSFASPWLTWHINRMLHRLTIAPNSPALAMDTGLFPRELMDRIEDYAERSDFNKAMQSIAFDHGDKAIKQAKKKAIFMGVMAMCFIAIALGIIMLSNIEFNEEMERYINMAR